MNKYITCIIASAAFTGLVMIAQAADDAAQSEFPQITAQPTDQGIWAGSTTTFAVGATNGDLTYQWTRNGVALEGQTNSALNLESVGTNDVGFYSCEVAKVGGDAVPTRAASLNVLTASILGGGPITVFGMPQSGGGSSGACPGHYTGCVMFQKTVAQGWGWIPSAGQTVHTASDLNRTDTKVQVIGKYGDIWCGPTTVSINDPTYSPKYRFVIYFTNNVPTNAYAITLDGFDP